MRITRRAVVLMSTLTILALTSGAGEAVGQKSSKLGANGRKSSFSLDPPVAFCSGSVGTDHSGNRVGITPRRSNTVPPYVRTSSANIPKDLCLQDAASGFAGTMLGAKFQTSSPVP